MSAPDTAPTAASPAAVDRENPWPGLGSYDESMHGFFFGRDAEVEELLRLVRRDPVALFYGQSGLGKSSLLQAGLFPRLRAADLMPVHIRLRFGAGFPHPVAQILQEVAVAANRAGGEAPAAAVGGTLFEYFYDETHEFWSARNRVLTPVIVFDQFEEIFTLGARDSAAAAHRDELLAQLADLAARRAPAALVARFEHDPELASRYALDRTRCRLLFSLREDFLPELGALRDHLPTLASGGLRLQRLRGHQAREVLEKPGAHLLEPDTTERIIRFVAAERTSGGAHELSDLEVEPALLNVVARELNNRRRARGLERISADLVHGARDEILVDFYERAFTGLEPHVREFVEDQLLTITGFRDSVAVEDAEASYRVSGDRLAVLVDRRLLRIDERFQMQRVELTHDLLAGVVKASRDSRRAREATAAERRRAEEAKRAAEQAATEAQARLRHTRTRALIGTVMAALLVGVGGLIYLNQRKAEEARRLDAERTAAIEARLAADVAREEARTNLQRANEAMAGSLLVQSEAALSQGSFDTARMFLRMGEDHGIFAPEALGWFAAAVNQPRILELEARIRFADAPVQMEFGPAGSLLVLTRDGSLRTTAIAPGAPDPGRSPTTLPGELGRIEQAQCFGLLWGQQTLVAVGTRDRRIHVCDLLSGRILRTLRAPDREEIESLPSETEGAKAGSRAETSRLKVDEVLHVVFSPDGRSLAALVADATVVAWRLTGDTGWLPPEDSDGVAGADFQQFATRMPSLGIEQPDPTQTSLAWAADGSLIAGGPRAIGWLERPAPAWSTRKPVETFSAPGLHFALRPGIDGRSSEWFVTKSAEARLVWLRLPPGSKAESDASKVRTTERLPDTVHALASLSGSNVVFIAMRNGAIGTYLTTPAENTQGSLRLIESVATPRARDIGLRIRPDGRYLAILTDDGTACLYRIRLPEPAGSDVLKPVAVVAAPAGQVLQVRSDGTVTATNGSQAPWAIQNIPGAHNLRSAWLPAGDGARGRLFLDSRDSSKPEGLIFGVYDLTSAAWLWRVDTADGDASTPPLDPGSTQVAVFSPDGSRLAVGGTGGRLLVLDAGTGALDWSASRGGDEDADLLTGPSLRAPDELLKLAWSGDGRRVATIDTQQEIAVYEPGAGRGPVLTLHARSSRITGFALDGPGHTLGYTTPDSSLVIERIPPGGKAASLMAPLGAPVDNIMLAHDRPDSPPEIVSIIENQSSRSIGRLPSEAELEWITLREVDGYQSNPVRSVHSDISRISPDIWSDDASCLGASEAAGATAAWLEATANRLLDTSSPLETPELAALHASGLALRARLESLASRLPVCRALRDHLTEVTGDLVAFSREVAPDMPVLQRWTIVRYQQSLSPTSEVAEVFAIGYGLPGVVELLKQGNAKLTSREQAEAREIVRLAAVSGWSDNEVWKARTRLRDDLFSAEQWLELIFACPNAFMLDREASAQAAAGDLETSNSLYLELERRKPATLAYPIRRGNNLRRMPGHIDEALALFDRAAAAGDGETQAEARVYRAWTLQATEGRLPDATADMIEAARLAPADPWTLRNAIEFLISNGPPADAVGPASHLIEAEDTPANRILQARVLLATGDGAGARLAVESLASSDDIAVRLDVVELLSASTAYADLAFAAEWAHAAYQATSDRALEERALRHLGPLWLAIDELVSARNALNRILDYKLSLKEQATVHALMGRIDMRRRQFVSAREAFETALRLDPRPATRVRRDFACLLAWTGDTAGALEQFRQAAAGGDADDALALVQATQRLETPDAARRTLAEALARFPDDRPLRLAHAWSLLASDPAAARLELAGLADGSRRPDDLMATALLGRAAETVTLHLTTLGEAYADDWMLQAQLEAIAYDQTREPRLRLEALQSLSIAINRGFRGDIPLLALPGFAGVADDPLFQLAGSALAFPEDSRDGLLAIARFNLRTAALAEHPNLKSSLLKRAGSALSRGVALEVFTPADVLADPELAPFAGQF